MAFAHTPYDGSKQPFTAGLEPLAGRDWIEVDSALARDLDEKERLLAARRGDVARDDASSRAAQAELLAMLVAHLPARFPAIYARQGNTMAIAPARRAIILDGDDAPIVSAARLVQEISA